MKYLQRAVSAAALVLFLIACSGPGAEHTPEVYSLQLEASGEGAVATTPDKSEYSGGEMVEITATPAEGWFFSHWEGDLTGSDNPVSLEIESDSSVTAVFTASQYILEVDVKGEGSISLSPDQSEHGYGSEVTLTAEPEHAGWAFSYWEGDFEGTDNPATMEITGDANVTAVFTEVQHLLEIVSSGQGVVEIEPDEPDYEHGQEVELNAIPSQGWLFSHWDGDFTGSDNPIIVEMDAGKSIDAVFTPKQHAITVDVKGQGAVLRDPEQAEYDYGSAIDLTAIPADRGWRFSHWEGDVSGSDNPVNVEVDNDKNVKAVFTELPHTLDVAVSGSGAVDIVPDLSEYLYGEEVELTAVPEPGSVFSHWADDLTGSDNPATLAVIGETEITAHFTSILSGLTSNFYNSMTVNNRVHGMHLNLHSALPVTVNIHRVEVRRADGSLHSMTDDPSILGALNPGGALALSVSPAIPPLLSEVRSYTVHWYGTYDNENFEKIGSFIGF